MENKEKQIKPVVQSASLKKKSLLDKFVETFISDEADSAKDYVIHEVIVPAIKDTIVDAIENAVEIIFDTGKSSRRKKSSSTVSYVSYNDYSKPKERRTDYTRARAGFAFDNVEFDTQEDAKEVLHSMQDIIDSYDSVSVLDYYELSGMPSPGSSACNYGWYDITGAQVVRVGRRKFVIKLPKCIDIR